MTNDFDAREIGGPRAESFVIDDLTNKVLADIKGPIRRVAALLDHPADQGIIHTHAAAFILAFAVRQFEHATGGVPQKDVIDFVLGKLREALVVALEDAGPAGGQA